MHSLALRMCKYVSVCLYVYVLRVYISTYVYCMCICVRMCTACVYAWFPDMVSLLWLIYSDEIIYINIQALICYLERLFGSDITLCIWLLNANSCVYAFGVDIMDSHHRFPCMRVRTVATRHFMQIICFQEHPRSPEIWTAENSCKYLAINAGNTIPQTFCSISPSSYVSFLYSQLAFQHIFVENNAQLSTKSKLSKSSCLI